ncbi:MAG: gliding motility-associated C-terminal domain-containing protein, partial [Bacteroidota bacterium]
DFTYSWVTLDGNILSGANSLMPVVNQSGEYTLTTINTNNGCVGTTSVLVAQDADLPIIQITPPEELNCQRTSLALNASGSSNTPELDIFWSTEDGNIVLGGNGLFPTVDAPGTYQLTISNAENGCEVNRTVVVSQNIVIPQLDLGGDVELSCITQMAELLAIIETQDDAYSINWSTLDGNIVAGEAGLQPSVDAPGTYQATLVDLSNFCTNNDEVIVFTDYIEDFDFSALDPSCILPFGQIDIGEVIGGTPPYDYSIDGGNTFSAGRFFPNLEPGPYEIVVQDVDGCVSSASVSIDNAPEPRLSVEPLVELQLGESYRINTQLSFSDAEIVQIFWSPAEGLSCTDCLRPVASPQSNQTYQVAVISQDGCLVEGMISFRVDRRVPIFFPNAFSPNGDGHNDVYFPFANSNAVEEIEKLQIFNRWGESVFENYHFSPNDPAQGWDGSHRGQILNPAVYVYQASVRLIDGTVRQFKGDVVLTR